MTNPIDRDPNHSHITSPNSQDHEEDFHQWHAALQSDYEGAHPPQLDQNGRPMQSLNNYPLYRASNQEPDDVFRQGGRLLTSNQLYNQDMRRGGIPVSLDDAGRSFGLVPQQERNTPSHYSSMTTSLPAAETFAGTFGRSHVYITDPQPHGRYVNGQRYDTVRDERARPHQVASLVRDRVGSQVSDGYALRRAQPYPVGQAYMDQQQVSVPGSVPSRSVRGVIPYDTNSQQLDYGRARMNDHYVPPRDYDAHEAGDDELGYSSEGDRPKRDRY